MNNLKDFEERAQKKNMVDIGEFMIFCRDFKIPVPKKELIILFKKSSDYHKNPLSLEQFSEVMLKIGKNMNDQDIKTLAKKIAELDKEISEQKESGDSNSDGSDSDSSDSSKKSDASEVSKKSEESVKETKKNTKKNKNKKEDKKQKKEREKEEKEEKEKKEKEEKEKKLESAKGSRKDI